MRLRQHDHCSLRWVKKRRNEIMWVLAFRGASKTGKKFGGKNKKYNTYDLSGEYGIGYTSKGEKFILI